MLAELGNPVSLSFLWGTPLLSLVFMAAQLCFVNFQRQTVIQVHPAAVLSPPGMCCFRWTVWVSEVLVTQLCPSLCYPLNCSPPDSSVHGTLQAKILEWVAIPFSRVSSQPRDRTWVSCIAGDSLPSEPLVKLDLVARWRALPSSRPALVQTPALPFLLLMLLHAVHFLYSHQTKGSGEWRELETGALLFKGLYSPSACYVKYLIG